MNKNPEEGIAIYDRIGMSEEEWNWINSGPVGRIIEGSQISSVKGDFGGYEAIRYEDEGLGEQGIVLPMLDKGLVLRVWNYAYAMGGGSIRRERSGMHMLVDQGKFGKLGGERFVNRLLREQDSVFYLDNNEGDGLSGWVTLSANNNERGLAEDSMLDCAKTMGEVMSQSGGGDKDALTRALGDVYPFIL